MATMDRYHPAHRGVFSNLRSSTRDPEGDGLQPVPVPAPSSAEPGRQADVLRTTDRAGRKAGADFRAMVAPDGE